MSSETITRGAAISRDAKSVPLTDVLTNPDAYTKNAVVVEGIEVPGLSTRRAKTTIELRDGQSFAIAGLLQEDYQNAISGLPWLADIPILGALFRSTGFQRNETELVILVTPHLVKPAQSISELAAPTERLVMPSDTDLFLFGRTEAEESGQVPATGLTEVPGAGDTLSQGQGGFSGPYGYITE